MTQTTIKTLSVRVKDRHAEVLERMAFDIQKEPTKPDKNTVPAKYAQHRAAKP